MAKKQKTANRTVLYLGVFFVLLFVFGYYYTKKVSASTQVTATADTTTTSTTYVQMDSMTVTPGAGDYLVSFSTSIKKSVGTSTQDVELYVGGAAVTHTARQIEQDSSYDAGDIFVIPVTIQAYVSGVGASDVIEVKWKTSSGTATAMERTLLVEPVSSADMSQATATATTTTTSVTDVQIGSMTLTPGAGNYMVYFGGSVENPSASDTFFSVYVNGAQVAHSERDLFEETSFTNTFYPVSLHSYVSGVGAGQVIEIKWRVSAGTASITERTLVVQKVDSADMTQVTATAGSSTTSTSDTQIDSMTTTPGAGDYLIYFGASIGSGINLINETVNYAIYVNGTKVSHSERQIFIEESFDDGTSFPVSTFALVEGVGVGELVEVKWRTTGNTVTVAERTLTLIKVGAGAVSSVNFGGDVNDSLENGLVGYWKMDESASPAIDSSGNGNSGTWNGNVAAILGKFGTGISLDGTTDYLDIGSPATLDNLNQISLSTWVYPNSDAGRIIDKQLNDNTAGWKVEISSSGDIEFTVDYDGATDLQVDANANLSAASWHHVFISWDGTSNASGVKIILDGVLQTSFNVNTSGVGNRVDDSARSVGVGCRVSGTNQCTSGRIDEMRLYSRALSAPEGMNLYNFAPGPIGHWKLDENTGSTAYDSSGNSLNGTLGGAGVMPTWNTGKYGSGVRFYPTSDSRISVADNAILRPGAITAEAWVMVDTISPSYQSILDKGWNAASSWSLYLESGTDFWFSLKNSAGTQYDASFTMTIVPNTWYHVAGVFDGTNVSIYVNGVKGGYSSVVSGTGFLSSTSNFIVSQSGSNVLNGTADDVKLYNYARTQGQILEDMNGGVLKPVSYWKFDEGQGTTASNSIGNEQNLTLSSSAWSNSGKFGKAWNGDGAKWSSIADASTNSKFDFAAADDFSISMWLKSDSTTNPVATEYLLSKAEAGAGYRIYVENDGSGSVSFGVDDDATWTPGDSVNSGVDVYDGVWHHIVAIKSGTTKIQLYVDGKLKQEDTSIIETGTLENATTLYLGDRNGANGGDEFFGDLDDVQIFRSALTTEQVSVLYNANMQSALGSSSVSSAGVVDRSASGEYCVPGDAASCLPPVGHWRFEEKSGTTANDVSGNGYSGTLTNSPTWVSGKFGSGVNTNSASAYVNIGDPVSGDLDFNTTDDFTVSAWIRTSSSLPNNGEIMYKGFGGSDPGYRLRLASTTGYFNCEIADNAAGTTQLSSGGPALNDGQWHYVACVLSGSGTQLTAYVDGIAKNAVADSEGPLLSAKNLEIGRNSATSYFPGDIDDVRIYRYARTPAQVAWDYNQAKPVAWWKMDECGGTALNDSMGVIAAGTIAPGASGNTSVGSCSSGTATEMWNDGTTGKRNSGLGFDSTDDAVSFGADSRLYLTTGGSIAAWIKPNSTGENSFGRIIDKSSDTSGTGGYGFQMDSGSYQFYGEIAGSTCISNPNAITMSTWNHVVWTFDGTNWKLYSNGILNKTCVNANLPPNTSLGVTIGNRQGATDRTFDGLIDDVRIYNYPLTDAQVKSVMNDAAVNIGLQ